MNKFINLKVLDCGFQYTFDNTTTHDEFEAMMNKLSMNDWKIFGDLVYFYRRRLYNEDESEDEEEEEDDSEDEEEED